jgi:hypothetical protein
MTDARVAVPIAAFAVYVVLIAAGIWHISSAKAKPAWTVDGDAIALVAKTRLCANHRLLTDDLEPPADLPAFLRGRLAKQTDLAGRYISSTVEAGGVMLQSNLSSYPTFQPSPGSFYGRLPVDSYSLATLRPGDGVSFELPVKKDVLRIAAVIGADLGGPAAIVEVPNARSADFGSNHPTVMFVRGAECR